MKNYYKILEVAKDASMNDIKKAYKKLVLKYHPDKNPNNTEKIKLINEAYSILGDPEKRKNYDCDLNIVSVPFTSLNPFNAFDTMFFNMVNTNTNYSFTKVVIKDGKKTVYRTSNF